jgi:spore germination protein GerM
VSSGRPWWRPFRPHIGLLAVLAGVVATVSACGVPTQGSARSIPAAQVPYHLLSPATSSTTTTTQSGHYTPVYIYLLTVSETHVTRQTRLVPPPISLTVVLDALLRGPTPTEQTAGMKTALSPAVKVLGTKVPAHSSNAASAVATVDFNTAFGKISGQLEVLAVAQVTYTVAATLSDPDVSVQFQINGIDTDVPLATGALVISPVKRSDYASFTSTGGASVSASMQP